MADNCLDAPTGFAVESPCNGDCEIDPDTGWCLGCWRTIREIARWSRMTPEERQQVLSVLPDRAAGRVAPEED